MTDGLPFPHKAHDIFTTQPFKGPSVFYIKSVLHNWSDHYVLKILEQLRCAASADTRLIVADILLCYTCHEPPFNNIPGSRFIEAPAPLLPNYGAANELSYMFDMVVRSTMSFSAAIKLLISQQMMAILNAQERTLLQMTELLRNSRWKVVSVQRKIGCQVSHLVAVPD
jgi:hypothetical protein